MKQLKLKAVVGSVSGFLTIQEIKDYLRISNTSDDALLIDMRDYAVGLAEKCMGIDIISKTRVLYIDELNRSGSGSVILPFTSNMSNLSVVLNSVKDQDQADIDSADYEFKGLNNTQIVFKNLNQDDIYIDYTTPDLFDNELKIAVLKILGNIYDFRADFIAGKNVNRIPSDSMEMLNKYKIPFI